MGLNPGARSGRVTIGEELLVPPFNGIRVEVSAGQNWRDLAKQYRVRPDVLFEVNGCQRSPSVVFIPGVNWSPVGAAPAPVAIASPLSGYPLQQQANVLLGYGWYIPAGQDKPVFHSGLDLAANPGTSVVAIAAGTVAFAGPQGGYGNLVVINHEKGYQTRYAQLASIRVKVGQPVNASAIVGTVGRSGSPSSNQPHLHFELRSNSSVGWVAEDPSPVIRQKQ
jgi:lysostaphin